MVTLFQLMLLLGLVKKPLTSYTCTRKKTNLPTLPCYLCDFATKYIIKIVVYLESPQKVNFNFASEFFSTSNF